MRMVSLLAALVVVAACSGDPVKNLPPGQTAGVAKWTLTTYNGGTLPYSGTLNANGSVNRVDSGTLTLDDRTRTYLLDIRIVNTLGATTTPQDYSEVGSFAANASGGYTFKPNDISGGTDTRAYATVPVSVSGNTLSFPQQGKTLTFARQ
jgi:hypothetical protein